MTYFVPIVGRETLSQSINQSIKSMLKGWGHIIGNVCCVKTKNLPYRS